MKSLLFILMLAFLGFKFFSCTKIFPNDTFTLKKQNNYSKKIKLHGFYFNGDKNNIYDSYVFYENGVILNSSGSGSGSDALKYIENLLISPTFLKKIPSMIQVWGLYEINGDEIKFERYYPSSGGPAPAYIRSGKILNDTTFIITQSMRSNGTEIRVKNEIYHFKKFSPKPDSTNNFIN